MPRRFGSGLLCALVAVFATSVQGAAASDGDERSYALNNAHVMCTVFLTGGTFASDKLETTEEWQRKFGGARTVFETDADFQIGLMWTGWQYPGKDNNADNFVSLSKRDFELLTCDEIQSDDGSELRFYFEGKRDKLLLCVTYRLEPGAFYVKRRVAVSDTVNGTHFLHAISPRKGFVRENATIVKAGEFGQPIGLEMGGGGVFLGLEYPASVNRAENVPGGGTHIECFQEFGQKIGSDWVESEWVVAAVTPDRHVKRWFMEYVADIRVAPVSPYALYNSWYDLRSPEYPGVPEGNVMSEESVLRIIGLIRENILEKHGIKLDAFVLDDGWDEYDSDWRLRKEQFPRGMKPIADELRKTGTDLGIWFGPTGGYSFRMRRIDWMKERGYETVGEETDYNTAMLCLAGENYSALFRRRVVDFVEKDDVGYFKWDGIQFSCSESGHGHSVGLYSRRAVMESVIDKCRAVRNIDPDVYLNITSGTWLSPWWTKYANQIWMAGSDYGYADVPSISKRDAAITYRDFVLYDDFVNKDLWFPIANLMTHGIIKGNLQKLGGEKEPLDKFTDNALLYFARGVSMWELYISPDILTDDEWNAIGTSMAWAKNRFDVLGTTSMIGGDPTHREPYGYAHYRGKRGIVAVRNPFIASQSIGIELDPSQGLDPEAASLVLERVYPTRWVSPVLYRAGSTVALELGGYETAVYEVYPLEDATEPLLSGVVFDAEGDGNRYSMSIYAVDGKVKPLNRERFGSMSRADEDKPFRARDIRTVSLPEPVDHVRIGESGGSYLLEFTQHETVGQADVSILIQPDDRSREMALPEIDIILDAKTVDPRDVLQKGMWAWYSVPVTPGEHELRLTASLQKNAENWTGTAAIWFVGMQRHEPIEIEIETNTEIERRVLPPRPWKPGEIRKNVHLGDVKIEL